MEVPPTQKKRRPTLMKIDEDTLDFPSCQQVVPHGPKAALHSRPELQCLRVTESVSPGEESGPRSSHTALLNSQVKGVSFHLSCSLKSLNEIPDIQVTV